MSEIQLFIKWIDGKTQVVDVEDDATIAVVKAALKEKLDDPPDEIHLQFHGRTLDNDKTLKELGIVKESTLVGTPVVKPQMPAAYPVLQQELGAAYRDFGENEFVLVSLGCYDFGKNGVGSIKHQQCPDTLIHFCRRERWDLTIFLVDPMFTPDNRDTQIYDIPSQGWVAKPVLTMCGGDVRLYQHGTATFINPEPSRFEGSDCRVLTFATSVPEYIFPSLGPTIADRTRVAGMPLAGAFARKIKDKQLANCAFVSGNIHGTPRAKTEYITVGNQAAVMAAGFQWNP